MSDLKFNPSRHDQRIAAQQSEKAKAKALKAAGTIYQDWKRRLLKDKKATTSTIADAVLDLRTAIHKHFSAEPELTEWTAFTLKMLDDKLGVLTTLDITAENRITRYIPKFADPSDAFDTTEAIPESTVFRAEEQLRAIPFVQQITEQPGFIGFVLDASILVAMFDDGEIMPVGAVLNGVGLEKIPGIEDYRQALLATQTASDAAATTGDPESASQSAKPATNGHPAKSTAKATPKARRPRF
jgi:hypothetical protein